MNHLYEKTVPYFPFVAPYYILTPLYFFLFFVNRRSDTDLGTALFLTCNG